MSNGSVEPIQPYAIERVCKPQLSTQQLVLHDVDRTESVYFRTLIGVQDAGLPDLPSVRTGVEQGAYVDVVHWDLGIMLNYRQDWSPTGYGLGELVYTMSLLPNEELTLEVKTWETDKRMEEKETALEDRNTSDIGSTSSSSSELTDKTESKEHTYVDAKAGYSGFGFSASVSAGWSQDVATMNQQIGKQAQERTQKASSEQKSSQKVKMSVSRESGSESKTTRRLKNINQAHTLNASFFQVLQEYKVTLRLVDALLVILGEDLQLDQSARSGGGGKGGTTFLDLDGGSSAITWGQLLRHIQDTDWIRAFTLANGVSPIQVLREAWARPLKDGALAARDWWKTDAITDQERTEFQATMLKYVRPTSGWVEPGNDGVLRWAYEVVPGREKDLLKFLYQFVPYTPVQVATVLALGGMAYQTAISAVLSAAPTTLTLAQTNTLQAAGPFKGMRRNRFVTETLPAWVSTIMDMLDDAKAQIGDVAVAEAASYKVTLPTLGVYADVTLGVCSGAEDWIEVNRQFDLELKQLAIEKLRCEVERAKAANQRLADGEPFTELTVQNPTDNTKINLKLDLTGQEGGTSVKVESGGGS